MCVSVRCVGGWCVGRRIPAGGVSFTFVSVFLCGGIILMSMVFMSVV